ncbi:MAG: lysophospholipid acyltransferase family protein [Vampirovibrionales bacterium]|nr:lysophospholipid acyltransferase family protein [Vampirovibrionales bacterium]
MKTSSVKPRCKIPFAVLRILSWTVLKVGFCFKIKGQQHLKETDGKGPLILAGNHTGLLDSLIVLAAFPRQFYFLMHETVFTWAFVGKLVGWGNIVPLNPEQPKASLAKTLALLKAGTPICIFPEGKLSRDGEMNPFSDGVAFLQQKSNAAILPFCIIGGFRAWREGTRWPKFTPVTLVFGAPIYPGVLPNHHKRAEITGLLKARIQALQVQHVRQITRY